MRRTTSFPTRALCCVLLALVFSALFAAAAAEEETYDVLGDELPMLVNKDHPVPEDFIPADLVLLTDILDPSLVNVKKLAPGNINMQTALASVFVIKYGSIIVMEDMTYEVCLSKTSGGNERHIVLIQKKFTKDGSLLYAVTKVLGAGIAVCYERIVHGSYYISKDEDNQKTIIIK